MHTVLCTDAESLHGLFHTSDHIIWSNFIPQWIQSFEYHGFFVLQKEFSCAYEKPQMGQLIYSSLHSRTDHMNQENPLNPGSDTAEPFDLHVSIANPERTLKSSFSQRKHTYHKLCGKLINKLHRYERPRLPLLGSPEVRGGSRRYVIEINMSQ